MGKRDERVDAYIANSAAFAEPILTQIREHVHSACPEVEETIKWSFPHFDYKGIMCSMAAFKQHCAMNFWKAALIEDSVTHKSSEAMGQFGRLTSVKDLPSKKVMTGFVKQAMKLNDAGIIAPRNKPKATSTKTSAPLAVPSTLAAALTKNRKALDSFDAFTPSHRKEYIEWITEAKTDATRDKRIEQAIKMMADGKSRHWKYQK